MLPHRTSCALVIAGLIWIAASDAADSQTAVAVPDPTSATEFDALFHELKNWGRWGHGDQIGTLNLITPETRLLATRLIREGTPSRYLASFKPMQNQLHNDHEFCECWQPPQRRTVTAHTDEITIAPHGAIYSHFDAPPHFFYRDQMYNGVPRADVTERGAARLSVNHAVDGIYTRGVLLDIARLKNLKALEPGYPITVDDLEVALKQTGLTPRSGDAVLIRTGRATMPPDRRAGLHVSTVKWLKDRDVAVAGSDDSIDAWPSGVEGIRTPIHVLLLVAMGTPILDHLDLNELADAATQRRRWEFALTVDPLPVTGATGSVVNPIAYF